jgi:adenylate cyclase
MRSLFKELRRRQVFGTVALYVVAAWVIIQVAGEVQDAFGFQRMALRFLWIAALAGFPAALIFGWYYDITGQGIVHTPPADADTHADQSLTRTDYLIFSAFILVVIVTAYPFVSKIQTDAHQPETSLFSEAPANSIAVLPFVNMSQVDDEYFSDGLTEELIGSLAKVKGLHVTARTSAFAFKGENRDIRIIGQRLNVKNVLEGSVRREKNRVRITAYLINVESGFRIWSDSYDDELESMLGLQESIARSIVRALRIQLAPEIEKQFRTQVVVNPEAYDLYLKGRYYWAHLSESGFQQSIDAFQKATMADSGYAPPHAGLATVYSFLGYFGFMPPREAFALSVVEANNALALDPNSSEALIARGMARFVYEWNWNSARDDLTRALELSPNYSQAHWAMSQYQAAVNPSAAFDSAQRALSLDPLSLPIMSAVAFNYFSRGMFEEAIEMDKEMLALDPGFAAAHFNLGLVHMFNQRFEAAIGEFTVSVELSGEMPSMLGALAYTYAKSGDVPQALIILEKLKSLREQSPHGYSPAFQIAYVYEGLGRTEDALDWLDKAFEERDGWLVYLNVFPKFESLRSEERFQDMLRRLNLPESGQAM